MIAFTNHALDHMLSSVLDANITRKIVRLGSRSADERISQFSMENIEKVAGQSRLDRAFAGNYRNLKSIEEEIKELTRSLAKAFVDSEEIMEYLEICYPNNHFSLSRAPLWIEVLRSVHNQDGTWTTVGKHGQEEESDDSLYNYWRSGQDLDFLLSATNAISDRSESGSRAQEELSNSFNVLTIADDVDDVETEDTDESSDLEVEDVPLEEEWLRVDQVSDHSPSNAQEDRITEQATQSLDTAAPSTLPNEETPSQHGIQPSDFSNLDEFFQQFGYIGTPLIPSTKRSIEELLSESDVWLMSRIERESLHAFFLNEVRIHLQQTRVDEYRRLRERHADAQRKYREGKEEVRFHFV